MKNTLPFGLQFFLQKQKITRISFLDDPRSIVFSGEKDAWLVEKISTWLSQYTKQQEPTITLPLDFSMFSSFYQKVYAQLQKVNFGSCTSYQALARQIGSPKASRAVGLAMKKNLFPLIVPCHRVLRKDGGLGGFAYGLEVKKNLLNFENPTLIDRPTSLAIAMSY